MPRKNGPVMDKDGKDEMEQMDEVEPGNVCCDKREKRGLWVERHLVGLALSTLSVAKALV